MTMTSINNLNFLSLLTNLNNLVTRITLSTRANYGPTRMKVKNYLPRASMRISITESKTTVKSNAFHDDLK